MAHCLSVELESPDGHNDTMLDPEQRIWGFETNFGGLADIALVKANQLMPKPEHLTWEEAASPGLVNCTAYRQLVSKNGGDMKQGDNVLIWGASGGLGGFATQYALNGGATPDLRGLQRRQGRHLPLDGRGADHQPQRRGLQVLEGRAHPGPQGVEALRCQDPGASPAPSSRTWVGYLQPEVAGQLDPNADLSGARAFRRIVAPAYLRRNQEDVLTELPEMVQVEEWEQFGPVDGAAYRDAVLAGNFMAMRRAAFAVSDAAESAKLVRLRELVTEAVDGGRRVIVFSYFLSVLEQVMDLLGDLAVGPLTGSVPVPERQTMVDALSEPGGPSVLVSQITAGGVGLNVQAASVVIFCEPQVKPTIEAQAVARAHRMGQTRTVQVHRLLVEQSVDQRMMEILGSKSALFEEFARQSEITDASPSAVDVAAPSETSLSRTILAEEQERLRRTP